MNIRIGQGYDVHQLAEGYDLWLGGVKIPHIKGAVGHSDADVILHAICDALLGAAAMGDIGKHFSNKDDRWKGIDSKILLKLTCEIIRKEGYEIGNVDSTLCLQAPKILPHIAAMKKAIAEAANINENQVSIKATTAEEMGFVGREEGVEAHAIALIYRP
jgi:2-C-methyl-D-erythritol 2,4-cyclodiphosphate synthase